MLNGLNLFRIFSLVLIAFNLIGFFNISWFLIFLLFFFFELSRKLLTVILFSYIVFKFKG